jgi:nucleotide-binding universal stress UspA family protein
LADNRDNLYITRMYERILVALDGSPAAEGVLEHAEALAAAFGSQITLVRATLSPEMVLAQTGAAEAATVEVPPTVDPEPILEADHDTAGEYLSSVAARLRQRSLPVTVETPEGTANNVIVERAKALRADLILMTTHGRGGLGRVVFGSTADSVMRHAPCPVLLVRIPDVE